MQYLFQYSLQNPHLSPPDALHQLVSTFSQQNPALGVNSMPPGQRTPGVNGTNNQFASPAVGHLGIPGVQGSPHIGGPTHTPSPAQNPVAGPVAMAAQQSQQGTNTSGSQGTSANTSPNVNNKRRRASTVKTEGDDNASSMDANNATQGNANKVKASPRVGGKRQKGTS